MAKANVSIEYIPVENLRFDPENPRLPSTLDKEDERAVLEWMLNDATIIELMGSIGEKGYFSVEPLLVIPARTGKGNYEVVEGNRRLSAVKLLRNPDLSPIRKKAVRAAYDEAHHRPDELPVLKYKNRNEILNYLGYRHITGIKPWDPLAKAKYLEQLRLTLKEKDPKDQFRTLAKIIGSKPPYIARLLTGLGVYEEIAENGFFGIRGLSEESIDFSILTTALQYKNLVEFLGLQSGSDPNFDTLKRNHLKELTAWAFERNLENKTRLGESRDLKELNAVVATKPALAAFRRGATLADAALLTGVPTDDFRSAIGKAKTQLQYARDYVHLATDLDQSDVQNLSEIEQLARFLGAFIKSSLLETEKV